MNVHPRPGDISLVLRAQPSRVPLANRLRMLLKVALRTFGLRCIGVQIHDGPPTTPEAEPAATAGEGKNP